jgi:flagella basal body P-ring formation protein FlgA
MRLLLIAALLSCAPPLVAQPVEAAPSSPAEAVATPFTRELLIAQLTRELSGHFNLEGDLQLEFIRAWAPPSRLAKTWSIEMLEYPAVAASSMLVRCRVLADDAAAADLTLVLRATLWRDAWVARQPLASGSTFDPGVLEVRRVDLFRERDALPAAVGDRSYALARSVGAGRMLTWHDVMRRPLVRRGDVVEVSAAEGQLIITMKALAMENGAEGDTVTVRNPESRRDFAAMVIDENRVQVRF